MEIIGRLTKKQLSAVQFFADNLFSKQMQRHLTLHFVFREKMRDYGQTIVNDYNDRNLPRDFIIEIKRNQPKEELYRTIAHEMVHVKQYVYNELNEQQNLWCGKKINSDEIPYHEQPWEIEAESAAYFLFEGFKNGNV